MSPQARFFCNSLSLSLSLACSLALSLSLSLSLCTWILWSDPSASPGALSVMPLWAPPVVGHSVPPLRVLVPVCPRSSCTQNGGEICGCRVVLLSPNGPWPKILQVLFACQMCEAANSQIDRPLSSVLGCRNIESPPPPPGGGWSPQKVKGRTVHSSLYVPQKGSKGQGSVRTAVHPSPREHGKGGGTQNGAPLAACQGGGAGVRKRGSKPPRPGAFQCSPSPRCSTVPWRQILEQEGCGNSGCVPADPLQAMFDRSCGHSATEVPADATAEEREAIQHKEEGFRAQSLANVTFVAQLFNRGILSQRVMHEHVLRPLLDKDHRPAPSPCAAPHPSLWLRSHTQYSCHASAHASLTPPPPTSLFLTTQNARNCCAPLMCNVM